MRFQRSILSSLAFIPLALAQTSTSCNPLSNSSCPTDEGLTSGTYSADFTSASSLPSDWTATSGSSLITYGGTDGATFTIKESGDSPTIQTNFYIFFGTISVFLRSAPGTGIVSSIVLESDDLDEIDWEWIGGSASKVQTNYFGKGNTTTYDRAIWYGVDDAESSLHNYTVDWRSDATDWYVDSTLVRTLKYDDALSGKNYPQTPMRLKIGIWAGGDTSANSEGTVEWAGGATDFSQGPFAMEVSKVEIVNSNPASEYKWGDQTGDYESIEIVGGSSDSVSSAGTATATGTLATALAVTKAVNTSGVSTASLTALSASTATAAASSDAIAGLVMPSRMLVSVAMVAIVALAVW